MVDGKSPAEPWLKEAFEDEYPDAELEWELLLDRVSATILGMPIGTSRSRQQEALAIADRVVVMSDG